MSGIQVVEIRVRNFRSLREINLRLDRVTVLIGTNNSGKTAFLEAMLAALGPTRRFLTEDDVFLASTEKKVPSDRTIVVDVLIRPTDKSGKQIDSFPVGSSWTELWGTGIAQDRNDHDFMAFRTEFKRQDTGEYTSEKRFMAEWPDDPKDWNKAKITNNRVMGTQIEPITLYFIDAKRDIEEDLRKQGSFWRRLTADLGLTAKEVETFEAALNDINQQIIKKSEVLRHVKVNLEELYQMVSSGAAGVEVTPVASHLRDLGKAIDVTFATKDAQSFPLARHGMGTRSLASLLVFRAYVDWRCKRSKTKAIHPLLGLEEPEAHLHPHAQRALFQQIESIPGQLVISSHSPYFSGQAQIGSLRHFGKTGPATEVSALDIGAVDKDDIAKINRAVINTRGDVLYAHALIIFEGDTEELALPYFAERYWGRSVSQLGLSFVGVGGFGKYLPFLRMAESFCIPWFVLSDGETDALKGLTKAVAEIGVKDVSKDKRIVILPGGLNFEGYILHEGYADAVETMFTKVESVTFVDDEMKRLHGQAKSKTLVRDYKSAGGRNRALMDFLELGKTRYGRTLAEEICALSDPKRHFPSMIKKLFESVSDTLNLPKK